MNYIMMAKFHKEIYYNGHKEIYYNGHWTAGQTMAGFGDASIIIVFNQLLQYTFHSNTGLSHQDGESKELYIHVTRVGHNLCNPHGLLPGFTSNYEF